MSSTSSSNTRLLDFVVAMTRLVQHDRAEAEILDQAGALLSALVAHDDWLPQDMARSHPEYYQQYLLYGDPLDRFSLVSFVWGPGQKTPIHDHTVWGIIGMLRGAECDQHYAVDGAGQLLAQGEEVTLQPGQLGFVSPRLGDIHVVRNAFTDRDSISIHLYGGNIGRIRRHVYTPDGVKAFVSGYVNARMPNLWVG